MKYISDSSSLLKSQLNALEKLVDSGVVDTNTYLAIGRLPIGDTTIREFLKAEQDINNMEWSGGKLKFARR